MTVGTYSRYDVRERGVGETRRKGRRESRSLPTGSEPSVAALGMTCRGPYGSFLKSLPEICEPVQPRAAGEVRKEGLPLQSGRGCGAGVDVAFDFGGGVRTPGNFQIVEALQVHPQFGIGTEVAGEA